MEELTRLETSLWQAATRFDRDYMNDLLADDFVEFGRSGRTYNKAQALAVQAEEIRARIPLEGLTLVGGARKLNTFGGEK